MDKSALNTEEKAKDTEQHANIIRSVLLKDTLDTLTKQPAQHNHKLQNRRT